MKKKSDELHKNKTEPQDATNMDKRAEESQSENAEKYQNILKNIHDGCFELDLAGNFTFFNDSACRILGYSREELMGMNYRHYTDKENAKKVSEAYLKVYNTGEPSKGFNWEVIRKDGTKRYIEVSVSLQKDLSDKPTGFIGIVNDITERKLSEKELRKSEEKYRLIFEYSPLGLLSFDEKGVIVACNDNFVKIIGSSREKLIGLNMLKLPNKKIVSAVQKALNGSPGLYEGDYSSVTAEKITPVRCLFEPMDVGGGRIPGGVGIIEDITERKLSEKKLLKSEEKYRTILENIEDGYYEVDLTGNFTFFNNSMCRILGYPQEAMMCMNNRQFTDKENSKKLFQAFNKVYKTGESAKGFNWEVIRKDGTKRYIEVSVSLQKNSSGQSIGFQGIARDITEQKKAEEALKESEKRYRLLADNVDDIIFVLDMNLNFTYVSPSIKILMGYEPEEFLNLRASETMTPSSWDLVMKKMSEIIEIEKSEHREINKPEVVQLEMRRKDGSTVWTEVKASFVRDENKRPVGIIGVTRDITERKKWEEELQKTLESLRKSFGATIQVMVSAVEMKDPYTAGHQHRSADLARAIATEMGLPKDKIDGIRMAGSIHDIGKLSIPAEILSKPTKLTEIEFSLIKEHARSGYEMLKDVESPWPLAEIVYQHHERMNGSGYPRNLKGDKILIESRILAIADVVEAMASHRPYRPTLGIEAALEEIEKNKGILYDNTVADACLRLFREKNYQLK